MLIRNGVLIILALAAFAVVHSLTAGLGLKPWLKRRLGERVVEGWYRLAYNVFSVITLLPVGVLLVLLPDSVLYRIEGVGAVLLRLAQAVGALGLVGALLVTDVWRFTGIRQAVAYLRGEPLPLPEPPLVINGMYRFVRHPLYFFSLLALWSMPVMTVNLLMFNIGATLYFVIGSRVEERRLVQSYGEAYRAYQQRVPGLIPLLRLPPLRPSRQQGD